MSFYFVNHVFRLYCNCLTLCFAGPAECGVVERSFAVEKIIGEKIHGKRIGAEKT